MHTPVDQVAATILIDHSGSLNRFGKSDLALCAAETLALVFDILGIPHEILGFTTETWQGGRSREHWLQSGEPENPGRLCDLLHIIYRAFGSEGVSPPETLKQILRPELLKENVDGEALEWAENRLMQRPERDKLLILVSDGAPVDDSTMVSNTPPSILVDHLVSVIKRIDTQGLIHLLGVGVHHRVDEYFSESAMVESVADAPGQLVEFILPRLDLGH